MTLATCPTQNNQYLGQIGTLLQQAIDVVESGVQQLLIKLKQALNAANNLANQS